MNVQLRFVPEGGPESGHVRVLLTPEERPLTFFEARSAAQQAFLEAVGEKGIGENLKRITVVVRLVPKSDDPALEQRFLFVHKGGKDWAILPAE
ncbi:hypothetical protein [Propylenella binzhouense]|uniref:Uncharacterized protein n=1 Tax=Propylenella binzhouense TaxID=2555902 RepID=A0A964WVN0_9HYPH|nr:hypothetical protein [Propylenella binzhouense]MYZ50223.1 hypothetical protein [Propylenella binzhouense]